MPFSLRARIRKLSIAERVGVLAWLVALGTLRYRIPYGVSHRDEAFYSAMPYSFLIGNQPFFDERAIHQSAGTLLLPIYRAYLALTGSADGIILFNRYLYLLCIGFCSVLAHRLLVRFTSFASACWAAALLVAFGYFNLFALSYNTQGALGFSCGVLLSAHALLGPRPGRELFVANLCFLAAIYSYPGLVVALLPYNATVIAWLYWKTPRSAWRSGLLGLGAGLAFALTALAAFARWLGEARFERLREFQMALGYGSVSGLSKLDFYHSSAWSWRWALLAYGTVFVLLPLACCSFKRRLWLIALAGAFGCIASYWLSLQVTQTTSATHFFMAITLLAPACVALNRSWQRGPFLLVLVWAPSVVSMLAITYSSSNGLLAALLGSMGATVAGVGAFGALLEVRARANPDARVGYHLVLIAFGAACLGLEIHSMFRYVYDETGATWGVHDTRIRSGPMRGTITTRANALTTEAVDRDLKQLADNARTLTIFDGFATGYMSTRLRPQTWCQWIYWGLPEAFAKKLMSETFGPPAELPDLVLKITVEKESKRLWAKYERKHYHLLVERKELGYVILERDAHGAKPR